MRLLYRADGGHPIGTGHLYRAIRIIRELRRLCPVHAALITGDACLARGIAQDVPAFIVPTTPSFGPDSVKPAFRFASISELDCVKPPDWDLIAVDMLDTESDEMRRLAEYGVPIVTFDDRGDGRFFARGIINSLVTEPDPASLPPEVRLWDGAEFAVLDSIYSASNSRYQFRGGPVERVFVSMGGADAAGLTVKVARSLLLVDGIRRVEFGVGPAFPHQKALSEAVEGARWDWEVYVSLPNLLDRYLTCDLAIVAGGLTMFEACCVGVPALAVCQPIDHQLELSERLSAAGAMENVGYGPEASKELIAGAVQRLSTDESARHRLNVNGPKSVDGRGLERVARAFLEMGGGDD